MGRRPAGRDQSPVFSTYTASFPLAVEIPSESGGAVALEPPAVGGAGGGGGLAVDAATGRAVALEPDHAVGGAGGGGGVSPK